MWPRPSPTASRADVQVYESARGVGIAGQVYDGLHNPLADLAGRYGTFPPRGVAVAPLDW